MMIEGIFTTAGAVIASGLAVMDTQLITAFSIGMALMALAIVILIPPFYKE